MVLFVFVDHLGFTEAVFMVGGEKKDCKRDCVLCQKEELQKRIVEEQQNNNLSVEILNGNAESLTGLVGNAHALKEPGMDHSLCLCFCSFQIGSLLLDGCLQQHRHELCSKSYIFLLSLSDIVGATNV